VLLDTCLPGADGWQVLADLKADSRTQSIPVILTSLAEERKRAYGLGAAAYLVKPFGLDELKYELHRALPCLLGCDRPPFPQASARAEAFLLLAEDNPILAQSYLKYLERRHYRLTLAGSGAEVLALARQNPPDLVLMDIQMPDMDGLEAIRALRAGPEPRLARVPIIALTGLAMPGDREHCLNAGANAYLSKPVSLKQLAETIEALLAERGNTG
jgi:CheY-like chemotaxis protein